MINIEDLNKVETGKETNQMQKTKDPYNVIFRFGKKAFLIFKNIYVLYNPESTFWVDDRIRRIDQNIYAGDLIQNKHGMVMKYTAGEDIENEIAIYFGVDPDIIVYAAVNPKLNQNYDNNGCEISTYKMRERYDKTQKSWKPENSRTQKKTVYTTNEDNILSDEEKSLIESVLNIVINHHDPNDYEQVLMSIQKTIENKLDKHLVEDAVVISESAAGVKASQPINDVDAVLPPIITGLEGKGYNKNLKLIHGAANYWANKAREERFEKKEEE